MPTPIRDYDTTIARIAGNIAAGLVVESALTSDTIASRALDIAARIVARLRSNGAVTNGNILRDASVDRDRPTADATAELDPQRDKVLSEVADAGTKDANSVHVPVSTVRTYDLDLDLSFDLVPYEHRRVGESEGVGNLDLGAPALPYLPSKKLFQAFWEVYPRRVGKKAAEAVFHRLQPTPDMVATMLRAIEAQRRSRQWMEGIIPHAATWLRGERWTDELPAASLSAAVTWREDCPHVPTCDTPTLCALRTARRASA